MTTCNQIYAMPNLPDACPWAREKLMGRVLDNCDMFDVDSAKLEAQADLACRIHGEYDAQDGRRFAVLASLWFEGKPFAVVESAGREGDDHVRVVVTDWALKYKAEHYVRMNCWRPSRADETNADEDLESLGVFYGIDFVTK